MVQVKSILGRFVRQMLMPMALLITASSVDASDAPADVPSFVPGSFTLVVLPDTQYYHLGDNLKHFFNQTWWIAENKERLKIAYVIHLGDVTQDNLPGEWEASRRAYQVLDQAGIGYSIAYGNHDYYRRNGEDPKRPCLGSHYFTPDEFSAWPTYGGVMETGKMDNTYHLFEGNGTRFVIVNLQWSPPDRAVEGADEVLLRHPGRQAILVTHGYLYHDDTRYDRAGRPGEQLWAPGRNDGETLWQKLVRKHPNMRLVLSGHVKGDGQGRLTSTGDHGNTVHQILCNYQMLPEGGQGYLRLMEFLPDGRTIRNKTYSPSLDAYMTDAENQFTLTVP